MKCELCGHDVSRKFEVYIPVKDKPDEVVPCCGSCKMLSEINDKLAPKAISGSPVMASGAPLL